MSEQQVAEAALAVVRPTTEPHIRASASRFLEEWTETEGAWEVYAAWLEHGLMNDSSATNRNANEVDRMEREGMQLLCLQLLQAKIRRHVPRGGQTNHIPILERIHICLAHVMMASIQTRTTSNKLHRNATLQSASICYAALSVRCGVLNSVVAQATSAAQNTMPPVIALRVLSNIPLEVEACADLNTSQVTQELWSFLENVLEACCRFMQLDAETAALATETLECWITRCHVSLSQLNSPIGNNKNIVVLPVLVHILSQSQYPDEQLPVKASRALTEVILVPVDACTDTRLRACQALLQSISGGAFIAAPLHYATMQGWEDACHALANLMCTLVTEEVDYCVTQPAETLLNLLLQIQVHPQIKVGCAVLECWLAVQEVPTGQRHDNWKASLFQRVVECLMSRMVYPPHFSNWEQEVDVDESEFQEFRRMVKDVLISSYFLLRVNFVRSMTQTLITTYQQTSTTSSSIPWFVQEAALFALTVTWREVCARIKARGGGSSVGLDREETAKEILALAQHFASSNPADIWDRHWLLLIGVCEWMGCYAAAWGSICAPESIYQILRFTCFSMKYHLVSVPAAKALKNIMVGCASKLAADPNSNHLVPLCIKEAIETVLVRQEEEAMVLVAEGCTRLVVQLADEKAAVMSLRILMSPIVQQCEAALSHVPSTQMENNSGSGYSDDIAQALDVLNKYMHVLQVFIKFCERRESASEIMNLMWPFLEGASERLVSVEPLFIKKLLAIHEQFLKNMPDLVEPRFEATIKYVVDIFEDSKEPNALVYVASSVEAFGSKKGVEFGEVLAHIFEVLNPHLFSKPFTESCDLIASFYQLCGRYILYATSTIGRSKALPHIVSLAVACLVECQGESESTREALNFLAKFYGWRSLPLTDDVKNALQSQEQLLDEIMLHNGARLIQSCMDILVGGAQILWGSCSDCVFVVVSATLSWASESRTKSIAGQWLESVHTKPEHVHAYTLVVHHLLSLAMVGQKNKAKAKLLLTDYSNICKGVSSIDVLHSYSLP